MSDVDVDRAPSFSYVEDANEDDANSVAMSSEIMTKANPGPESAPDEVPQAGEDDMEDEGMEQAGEEPESARTSEAAAPSAAASRVVSRAPSNAAVERSAASAASSVAPSAEAPSMAPSTPASKAPSRAVSRTPSRAASRAGAAAEGEQPGNDAERSAASAASSVTPSAKAPTRAASRASSHAASLAGAAAAEEEQPGNDDERSAASAASSAVPSAKEPSRAASRASSRAASLAGAATAEEEEQPGNDVGVERSAASAASSVAPSTKVPSRAASKALSRAASLASAAPEEDEELDDVSVVRSTVPSRLHSVSVRRPSSGAASRAPSHAAPSLLDQSFSKAAPKASPRAASKAPSRGASRAGAATAPEEIDGGDNASLFTSEAGDQGEGHLSRAGSNRSKAASAARTPASSAHSSVPSKAPSPSLSRQLSGASSRAASEPHSSLDDDDDNDNDSMWSPTPAAGPSRNVSRKERAAADAKAPPKKPAQLRPVSRTSSTAGSAAPRPRSAVPVVPASVASSHRSASRATSHASSDDGDGGAEYSDDDGEKSKVPPKKPPQPRPVSRTSRTAGSAAPRPRSVVPAVPASVASSHRSASRATSHAGSDDGDGGTEYSDDDGENSEVPAAPVPRAPSQKKAVSRAPSMREGAQRSRSSKLSVAEQSTYSDDDGFIQEDDGADDDETRFSPALSKASASGSESRDHSGDFEESVVDGDTASISASVSVSAKTSTKASTRASASVAHSAAAAAAAAARPQAGQRTAAGSRSASFGGVRRGNSGRAAREAEDSWEGELKPLGEAAPPSLSTGTRYDPHSESRERPASAAPRDRNGAAASDLSRRHPMTWDVRDVCNWIESIGLGQYRKKFMHNIVDGRVLLMLDESALKHEIGIGPLGHRIALARAIASLSGDSERAAAGGSDCGATPLRGRPMSASPGHSMGRPGSASPSRVARPGSAMAASENPRRPASASRGVILSDRYLGPSSGKVTVYEQRSKLLFELDRAAARAAQHKAIADQLLHTAELSAGEVAKLRGLLQDLESKNRALVSGGAGGMLASIDGNGRIPWRPIGTATVVVNPNPERFARPGDDPGLDMTFKPRISRESRRILAERGGDSGSSAFLSRLENDLNKRGRSKTQLDKKYNSVEAQYGDPMIAKKRLDRDTSFLSDYVMEKKLLAGGQEMPDSEGEQFGELAELIVEGLEAEGRKLFDKQKWSLNEKESIMTSKGARKVAAIVGAIRSLQFMTRYQAELNKREEKLRELQKKWWEMTMGPPAQRDDEDKAQMRQYFALLGWGHDEDAVSSSRLSSLFARAAKYKTEWEAWYDKNRNAMSLREGPGDALGINWAEAPFGTDGLQALMDTEMARSSAAAEAATSRGGKAVKTAGGGTGAGPVAVSDVVAASGGADYLAYTVKLLSGMRWDGLERLERLGSSGDDARQRLSVYRAIRTQKFIEFTESKIREREDGLREEYEALKIKPRTITKDEQDGFFERLLDDAGKRRLRMEKVMSDKRAREQVILASSNMYGQRPRSARA
ncbi:hypothetical protein FOA52_003469 [Chlamydomonas sp. UWO 241]|nr:hypothetical protein FOA52_003469 [Chlamydomonas sp. UWO 241]